MGMHAYATDCRWNPRLFIVLWFVSSAVALALGFLAEYFRDSWGIPTTGVSAIGVFGGFWWLFDHWLWKLPVLRRVLLVPDLNGTWKCVGKTVSQGSETVDYKWEATVTISQSWSKMLIRLETKSSGSMSLAASVYHDGDGRYRLIYPYANDPRPSEEELKHHNGLTLLLFDREIKTADGRYFTDGSRRTAGEMRLERVETSP